MNNCLLILIKLKCPTNKSSYDETIIDLEYALLVFSTNVHDPIDLNCSIRNHSFETEMMHDCPLLVELNLVNRLFSNSHCWTGSSIKWRLMRANLFTQKLICPHKPPFHARSRPAMGIRKWSICFQFVKLGCKFRSETHKC